MSAASRTVNIEGKGAIVYDSDMPMKALEGLMTGAAESSIGEMVEGLSQFVESWPFEGDPSDPDAWLELRRTEYNAAVTAVVEDLGQLGED